VVQHYHAFQPRPGELVRDVILRRSRGAVRPQGGDAPYRVVDFAGGTEFAGTRDQCIDFVELAWWQVETALTYEERVRAGERAVRLAFEREGRTGTAWERDVFLTSTIVSLHSL